MLSNIFNVSQFDQTKIQSAVQIRESQNFAKLSKIREFFPYLHDSLVSKISAVIFQNVHYFVMKMTLLDQNRKPITVAW